MKKQSVMINGLPGKMADEIFRLLIRDERFQVIPLGLTGPEVSAGVVLYDMVTLFHAQERSSEWWRERLTQYPGFIAIDFTHPDAVNSNAKLYRDQGVSFVIGTTGGNRDELDGIFMEGEFDNCAVIAPNMAKQVVLFQSMMQYAATNFPEAFKGYKLKIIESHQSGKADTSGTAKAMVRYFNSLGIPFTEGQIIKVREPDLQQVVMDVPETALSGHGFHTYKLESADGNVMFEFKHNVIGRSIYAEGVRDAVLFLAEAIAKGAKGRVFDMIHVLKGTSALS